MTEEINKRNWEIPNYDTLFWEGKQSDYCVIIPVINEGERIKNLLQRMTKEEIHHIADIIIVDGGSNDNSLEIQQLKSLNIKGLLLKTSTGKLSAQLRCGYSFALEKQYNGIVTIDGNNKDNPDAIPEFIEALKNGVDFVQASRFIAGGKAKNTPKTRHFAIRLIHAPLLSFASGFKWTDTTQGFRAYSCKMLLDPQIAPFRSIFDSYELLAYLSYRAPRLGYICVELPTTRNYPEGEVPTKISSLSGNLSVLKILFKACLGHYNP